MSISKILILFTLFCVSFSEEILNPHLLPRPLILEYTSKIDDTHHHHHHLIEFHDLELQCTSWRFAVEANNLNPWKRVPSECGDYVKRYMMGRGYGFDLETTAKEATEYVRGLRLKEDGIGKEIWVFDVDETLLSNLPYYAEHGYGLEVFDSVAFDAWVDKGIAPAIESSLKLYEEVLNLGIKVFLLTGRSEEQRNVTEQNLINVGFKNWDRLILRSSDDHGKPATVYKSGKRSEMVSDGYRIVGNSGDQWSDLLGHTMSARSFKLPNPMYYIP